MSDEPRNLPIAPYLAGHVSTHRSLTRDEETDVIRDRCMSGAQNELGTLMLLNSPSMAERQRLSARLRSIADNIGSHNRNEIAAAVADTIAGYRNFVKPNEDAKKVVAKYVKELAGLPTWACVRACTAIRLCQAPGISMEFPFSTMQLRALAESYITRYQDESAQISRILLGKPMAEPISDEERARVQRKFLRVAHQMKMKLRKEQLARSLPGNETMRIASDRAIAREYLYREQAQPSQACAPSLALLDVLQQRRGDEIHGDPGGAHAPNRGMEGRER